MAYGNSNEASPLGRLKSLNGAGRAGGSDQDLALSQDVRIAALPNCYTIVLDSKMLELQHGTLTRIKSPLSRTLRPLRQLRRVRQL